MIYIVFDLEFNQDFSSFKDKEMKSFMFPNEIIQIGALKLDSDLNTISTFNHLVKPTIYKNISPFITDLTGITTKQLQEERTFPDVYRAFFDFIKSDDTIFCIWGMSDIKELFRNVQYHQLNSKQLSRKVINIQPYLSMYLGLPSDKLLRLEYAVEKLNIPLVYSFHDALCDAHYTAEVFKKINNTWIQPKIYDPFFTISKPRQRKRTVDYDKLLQQFEKMYTRSMTLEEQEIIKLAYKMGKTNQFLK